MPIPLITIARDMHAVRYHPARCGSNGCCGRRVCVRRGVTIVMTHAAADLFDEIYAKGRPTRIEPANADRAVHRNHDVVAADAAARRARHARGRPAEQGGAALRRSRDAAPCSSTATRCAWSGRHGASTSGPTSAPRSGASSNTSSTSRPTQLRSHFDIAASVAADRPDAWLVTMTPKRKQIREGLSRLELWLDRATVMLTSMRMTFPNGDTKLMEFDDVAGQPVDRSRAVSDRPSQATSNR